MSVEVLEVDTDKVYINNKEVIRDMNGNWVQRQELTTGEVEAFNAWLVEIGERK